MVWPTRLPGVECLPRVGEAVIPDLVSSNRMGELFEEVSQRFSIILVDTPPVLPYVDADSLAQWADAIVLVVKSRTHTASTLKKVMDRLRESKVPIIGVVLNQVDPIYIERN